VAERTKKSKPAEKPVQTGTARKVAPSKPAPTPSAAKVPAAAKVQAAPAKKAPAAKKAAPKPRPAKKVAQSRTAPKPVQKLITFELEAPQAREVFVAGCFNDWDPSANPLERLQEGIWSGTVSIEPGEHQYRFIVDGEWRDDPVNTLRCWNEYGTENCILIIEE
jgi:hypothetical protein